MLVAAAMLLAQATFAIPAQAADAPGFTYRDLTHCAAFNLLVSQVMGVGDDAAAHKADADAFSDRASSLMVVATLEGDGNIEKVKQDVTDLMGVFTKTITGDDKAATNSFIKDNMATCTAMGQAAKEALDEHTKKD